LIIDTYNKDFALVETEIDRIRQIIEQQHFDVVQLIENEKNGLLIKLEDFIKSITSK
jgi:hypothetical protein